MGIIFFGDPMNYNIKFGFKTTHFKQSLRYVNVPDFFQSPDRFDIQIMFYTTHLKQSREVKTLLITFILNSMKNPNDFLLRTLY